MVKKLVMRSGENIKRDLSFLLNSENPKVEHIFLEVLLDIRQLIIVVMEGNDVDLEYEDEKIPEVGIYEQESRGED